MLLWTVIPLFLHILNVGVLALGTAGILLLGGAIGFGAVKRLLAYIWSKGWLRLMFWAVCGVVMVLLILFIVVSGLMLYAAAEKAPENATVIVLGAGTAGRSSIPDAEGSAGGRRPLSGEEPGVRLYRCPGDRGRMKSVPRASAMRPVSGGNRGAGGADTGGGPVHQYLGESSLLPGIDRKPGAQRYGGDRHPGIPSIPGSILCQTGRSEGCRSLYLPDSMVSAGLLLGAGVRRGKPHAAAGILTRRQGEK